MSTAPTPGPNTPEGRAISSKNATTTGLYTAPDYILPEEQSLYTQIEDAAEAELAPEGMLECRLAEEIIGAMWRLRRCHKLETELTAHPYPEIDSEKRQLSIERARNQATRLLHKNTAELRRLQTERRYRNEIAADGIDTDGFGVCDAHTAFAHADRILKSRNRRPLDQLELKLETMALESKLDSKMISKIASKLGSIPTPTPEITKRTPPTPVEIPRIQTQPTIPAYPHSGPSPLIARGQPCPCNSGQKYKRCCGKNAPPLLHHLARAA